MTTNGEIRSYRFFNNREGLILLILLGLSFAVRLYMVFHTYVITNDGVLYVDYAKSISQGETGEAFDILSINLYPLIIAILQKFFHNWEFSAQMVSALFGSLTIIPLYFLSKCLFNRDVALISSILYVFHPYLVRFSAEVIRGPTFWFFFTMALWLGWEAITRKRVWLFALTSLLGAISFLVRTEGIFLLPLIAIWVFLKDANTLKATYKKRILFALTLFLAVPILLSPVMLYLKGKTGRWHWARADQIPSIALYFDVRMNEIKKNFDKIELKPGDNSPVGEIQLFRLKQFLSLATDYRMSIIGIEMVSKFIKAIHPLLFIMLVFGVIKRRKIHYHKKEELFLLSVMVIIFLILLRYGTVYIYVGTRHMMASVILCLGWVGVGVLELEYRIRNRFLLANSTDIRVSLFRNLRWTLLILILFALLPKTLASQRVEKVPIKEAGIWMREHGPSDPVVMAQHKLRRIAFYADGIFLEIPRDQDLLEYVKKNHVNFLAINEKDIEKSNPGLIHSLQPQYFRKEVVIGKSSESYVIRIYSIKN